MQAMNEKLLAAIEAETEIELRREEPLSAHTTFRIGGPAPMAFPKDEAELGWLLKRCREKGETPVILGKGSNVLAPDEGLERLIICMRGLQSLEREGNTLTAGAGVTLAKLASAAQSAGLTGLEFAHGIPGTVGGGAVMNAGAYGGELKDVVTQVRCLSLSGEPLVKTGAELDFGYRHSCFDGGDYVITAVTVALEPGDPRAIQVRMEELMAKRRASQPLEYPSAGSTFKRPAGHYAAALIQDCGLKGRSVGDAQVSEKHAGFVINRGSATCADVRSLMRQVQDEVRRQTGVALEPEVKLL